MVTRFIFFLLFCLSLSMLGCSFGSIPTAEYSKLETPQETFQFAQKAVAKDDPTAFYYCLSKYTQKEIPLSDIKMAWSLAGSFFYLFLEAKIKSMESPAPEEMFHRNPETAKIILQSAQLEAPFLLHLEDKQWKLFYPSPYPLPDISKLKQQEPGPWRHETLVYYRTTPQQWFSQQPIQRQKEQRDESPRMPLWRTE